MKKFLKKKMKKEKKKKMIQKDGKNMKNYM